MLSSPPPASSYVSPATAGTSKQNKRLSLPRPLHLVEGSPVTGSSSSPASPFSPKPPLNRSGSDSPGPGTWSPKPAPSSFRDPDGNGIARNPRRQSSISYNTSQNNDRDSSAFSRSPLASSSNSPVPPILSLKRSTSVGGRPNSWSGRSRPAESNAAHERTRSGWKRETFAGSITPTSSLEDGSSPSADEGKQDGGAQATTPLTLAEKHADLLHFIAQKESKCLDLRTQLATHEAELLQLKKKWERIVERSFSRTHPSSAYNPGLSSVNPTSTATSDSGQSIHSSPLLSGTDNPSISIPTTSGIAPSSLYTAASLSYLDSLVTNTGRLLGLPGLSTPTSPAIPSTTPGHSSDASAPPSSWKDLSEERTPRSGTFPQNSQTHTPALSYSSTTTTSSVSARLSQDGEGEDLSSNASRPTQSKRPNSKRPPRSPHSRPNDLLIVTDTGATPLCSPNSEFEAFFGKGRRPHSNLEDFGSSENENENEDNWGDFQSANTDSQSQSLSRSNSLEINRSPSDLRPRRLKSKPKPPPSPGYDPDAAMGLGFAPPPSTSSANKDAEKERLAEKRRKRMSLPVTSHSSSNDETGSLASWMGLGSLSGGTKWDKFSGSIENALAKSPLPIPKRASILLSQLSQVPGLSQFSGVASNSIPETEIEAASSRSKGDTKTKTTLSTSSTSTSLLDEDVPPISSSSSLQPSLVPSRSTTPSGTGNKKATTDDGDDEWNW
ncbi:hypothetical protein PM082_011911 [Marasmius tenuissimus]|nr:hypothetical protein PM082_011911 [Marasmius tenuissimus]